MAADRPRLRILVGPIIALGPGKADLLEAIEATGSISAAARRMGMSYRRAWLLVDAMNQAFKEPLVAAATGGSHGGGAALTVSGVDVLRRFRSMEAKAAAALEDDFDALSRLLTPRRRA